MTPCRERPWQSGKEEGGGERGGVSSDLDFEKPVRSPSPDVWRAYHAGPGVLSDEGVPQHLGQLAHPERDVIAVLAQRTDTLLQRAQQQRVRQQLTWSSS